MYLRKLFLEKKNLLGFTVLLNIHTLNIYSTPAQVSNHPPTVPMKSLPHAAVLVHLTLPFHTVSPGMYKLYFHTETPVAPALCPTHAQLLKAVLKGWIDSSMYHVYSNANKMNYLQKLDNEFSLKR